MLYHRRSAADYWDGGADGCDNDSNDGGRCGDGGRQRRRQQW